MKKRLAALFCATLAASMILVGCQASKGLETDNLKITQYKGVEVSAADKPEKVTDDDVEQYIQSQLTSSAAPFPQRISSIFTCSNLLIAFLRASHLTSG